MLQGEQCKLHVNMSVHALKAQDHRMAFKWAFKQSVPRGGKAHLFPDLPHSSAAIWQYRQTHSCACCVPVLPHGGRAHLLHASHVLELLCDNTAMPVSILVLNQGCYVVVWAHLFACQPHPSTTMWWWVTLICTCGMYQHCPVMTLTSLFTWNRCHHPTVAVCTCLWCPSITIWHTRFSWGIPVLSHCNQIHLFAHLLGFTANSWQCSQVCLSVC